MTDAEHAAVLRRYQNGDASTLVEMRAAIERAINVLEWAYEQRAALADMGLPE